MRSYYQEDLARFKVADTDQIVSVLSHRSGPGVTQEQKDAWREEVEILKAETGSLDYGRIFLEFTIPRMGKRADAMLLVQGILFVIEFKVGEVEYRKADVDQCVDYALDMRNFHECSHDIPIAPVLVATNAQKHDNNYDMYDDEVIKPVLVGRSGLGHAITETVSRYGATAPMDSDAWERSRYRPTPTIIEAARVLYAKHDVADITRSESGAENLTTTTDTVERIIKKSKMLRRKSICFVTGVPGSGKTLAGLNLTSKKQDEKKGERAVFLSGNGPLIHVLQEALAQDSVEKNKRDSTMQKITKKEALRRTKVLIQSISDFLIESTEDASAPDERIVVFDEAQRAWDRSEMDRFMNKRQKKEPGMSEPAFLIDVMNRHTDWAVIVCLVGGGQEINHNEAGIQEWFSAVRSRHADWDVYLSNEITDNEYIQEGSVEETLGAINASYHRELHLATSIRSFRSDRVSKFVKSVLDREPEKASHVLDSMTEYPIVLTRDFARAKRWLKERSRGSERYGIVAAAKSYRLRPHGIYVELTGDAAHWFLKPPEDPRSSCGLEFAATEFKIQGLELDWACVAWDADLRYAGSQWQYKEFRGSKWTQIAKDHKKMYLRNAYRVLLTRARQGMVIFVPEGDPEDETRDSEFYDGTYCYLKDIGIEAI